MAVSLRDELDDVHVETQAFLVFSGAATALAGIGGLAIAGGIAL